MTIYFEILPIKTLKQQYDKRKQKSQTSLCNKIFLFNFDIRWKYFSIQLLK